MVAGEIREEFEVIDIVKIVQRYIKTIEVNLPTNLNLIQDFLVFLISDF